jgi:hypothetical protein
VIPNGSGLLCVGVVVVVVVVVVPVVVVVSVVPVLVVVSGVPGAVYRVCANTPLATHATSPVTANVVSMCFTPALTPFQPTIAPIQPAFGSALTRPIGRRKA